MQTIDFYYRDGEKATITLDGVDTLGFVPNIIKNSERWENGWESPQTAMLVVVTNHDPDSIRTPQMYTNDGVEIGRLTPDFHSLICELHNLYYPVTRQELVLEAAAAAGVAM